MSFKVLKPKVRFPLIYDILVPDPYTFIGSRPLTPSLTCHSSILLVAEAKAEHPESSHANNGPVAPAQNPPVNPTTDAPHETAEQDADDEAAEDTDDTRCVTAEPRWRIEGITCIVALLLRDLNVSVFVSSLAAHFI